MIKMLSSMRIALLTGGSTGEREVALASAAYVEKMIGDRMEIEVFDIPKDLDRFVKNRGDFDCVLPVLHGKGGENGELQRHLDVVEVPYVFSRPEAHAIGFDKERSKTLMQEQGHFVPKGLVVVPGESVEYLYPVVVKPVENGSSLGVYLVRSQEELDAALARVFVYDERAMVEELIEGREFTVAVIDGDGALPVVEIRSAHAFFDFESKYDPALCDELCHDKIVIDPTGLLHKLGLEGFRPSQHLKRDKVPAMYRSTV